MPEHRGARCWRALFTIFQIGKYGEKPCLLAYAPLSDYPVITWVQGRWIWSYRELNTS